MFLGVASSHAAFTPGRYEIQDLGGRPIGMLTVQVDKSKFEDMPATRIRWDFMYNVEPFKSTEKHEAYITKNGLQTFRKEIKDDKGTLVLEGNANPQALVLRRNDHGQKFNTSIPLKEFQISEYDLEISSSPFTGLKLKEAASAGVYSAQEQRATRARRNVNEQIVFDWHGKKVPVQVVNTSFSVTITTSWFTVKDHILLKERWADRQFIRVAD